LTIEATRDEAVPTTPAVSSGAVDLADVSFAELTPVWLLRGRNRTKADVAVYEIGGRRVAIKTYAERPAWVRHTIGRFLVRREAAAYRAAAGIDGLISFIGRPEPYALATEWVDGQALHKLGATRLDDRIFDTVAETLANLHAHGIAVADLHHRNIVVTADGHPFLLDLAAAWILGKRPGPVRRHIFQRLTELDTLALARMRARWTGGDTEQAVAEHGGPIAVWHRRGRRLKRVLRRLRGKR
jgi:hypothetical protein